jgi:adenine/guanine phosphoribosyltransferase-like PRPP-binding protein
MASKFLKSNFKSMNMSEEEKLKYFNKMRKEITGAAAGEKEIAFINDLIPTGKSINEIKKLVEEEFK